MSYNESYKTGVFVFSGGTTNIDKTNIDIHHNRISDMTPWAYNDGIKFFGIPATNDPYRGIKVHDNIIGPKRSQPEHPSTAWILADQGWIIGPDIAIDIVKNTEGHRIYNNIIKFNGNLTALNITYDAEIAACNNNLFYTEGSLYFTIVDENGQNDYHSFREWQTNLGFDTHSLNADPLLNGLYKPERNSPVIDAGLTLDSLYYYNGDLAGNKRGWGSGWDMGAYEYTGR